MKSNLSKTFSYVNDSGDSIIFEYDYGFLINKPNGIDTINVSINRAQGINQVGVTVQSQNVNARAVTISGVLVGEFQEQNKQNLLSIIRPDLKARLYADDYYLEVYPTSTPTITADRQFAKFQFSVLAPYPYWQRTGQSEVELSGVESKFRLWDGNLSHKAPDGSLGCWNISKEFSFGAYKEESFFYIDNYGQMPVPYTLNIRAKGTVVNPSFENVRTNEKLILNYTLQPSEHVVVEITHSKTYVTSSINGDIRGALSLKSNFYRLPVGTTTVKPDAESGLDDLEVSVSYATEVVGLYV